MFETYINQFYFLKKI